MLFFGICFVLYILTTIYATIAYHIFLQSIGWWYVMEWSDTFFCAFCLLPMQRNFNFLIPDAPELVHTFLEQEQDASCKRNAFMMLIHVDQVRCSFCVLTFGHMYHLTLSHESYTLQDTQYNRSNTRKVFHPISKHKQPCP